MKIEKTDFMIKARWANLNKNNTIADYCYEVYMKTDFYVSKMKVTEVVTMDYSEWYDFKNGLLEDREWLAGKGGTNSDYELSPEREAQVKSFFDLTREEQEEWRKQAYSVGLLVKLENSLEMVAVNPEGYNYARYVGIDVEEI